MKVSHALTQVRSLNNIHALVRSIVIYAVCIPLAGVIGYMLTKPLTFSEAAIYSGLLLVLIFPLLSKVHYPMMLFCWNLPVNLFFVKTNPTMGMAMTLISLALSLFNRIVTRQTKFITVPELNLPLFIMALVVIFTAELSGGFGLKSLGSEVYGGKKYVFLFFSILGFFALTARSIPPEKAKFYIGLFLLGCLPSFISDMVTILPGGLHFIYLFIPASGAGVDAAMGTYSNIDFGVTRLGGVGSAALGYFTWLMARYGVREVLSFKHPWRLLSLFLALGLISLSGFRSSIMLTAMLFGILFFMEKLHRTPLMVLIVGLGICCSMAVLPFAAKLPFVMQRSLSFLPLDFNPEAVASAEASSDWRIAMWTSVAQEVPKYLFLGKGYAISMEDWSAIQTANTGNETINAEDSGLAISGDYHNGPLSVIIPFGIWGVVAFLWIIAVCVWILARNQRDGLPALKHCNSFLLAIFLVKTFIFLTVFGALQNDLGSLLSYVGFSVALNNGVARPVGQMARQSVSRPPPAQLLRPRPVVARESLPG